MSLLPRRKTEPCPFFCSVLREIRLFPKKLQVLRCTACPEASYTCAIATPTTPYCQHLPNHPVMNHSFVHVYSNSSTPEPATVLRFPRSSCTASCCLVNCLLWLPSVRITSSRKHCHRLHRTSSSSTPSTSARISSTLCGPIYSSTLTLASPSSCTMITVGNPSTISSR